MRRARFRTAQVSSRSRLLFLGSSIFLVELKVRRERKAAEDCRSPRHFAMNQSQWKVRQLLDCGRSTVTKGASGCLTGGSSARKTSNLRQRRASYLVGKRRKRLRELKRNCSTGSGRRSAPAWSAGPDHPAGWRSLCAGAQQ